MEMIRGAAAAGATGGGVRQARASGGFAVPRARSAAVGPAAAAGEVGLAGMLALQELPDAELADREARRRGRELLAALEEMQRGLLGLGGCDPARLAGLAQGVPEAADAELRTVVGAITLRARIEAARRERHRAENVETS